MIVAPSAARMPVIKGGHDVHRVHGPRYLWGVWARANWKWHTACTADVIAATAVDDAAPAAHRRALVSVGAADCLTAGIRLRAEPTEMVERRAKHSQIRHVAMVGQPRHRCQRPYQRASVR